MPRPSFAEDDLRRMLEMADAAVEADAGLFPFDLVPGLREKVREIALAGIWLAYELEAKGATEDEIEAANFSMGQVAFGRDPWASAEHVMQRWEENRPLRPGPDLAERLVSGDVSDMPPGGARVRRPA